MLTEETEFLISRFVDGDLSVEEQGQLDAEIMRNPEALKALEHHLKVDVALKSEPPLPAINWDRLTNHISAAIHNESKEKEEKPLPQVKPPLQEKPWQQEKKLEVRPALAPARNYSMVAWKQVTTGILAMAAAILLVVGIWSKWNSSSSPSGPSGTTIARSDPKQSQPAPITPGQIPGQIYVFVTGENPAGNGVAQITIAPPPSLGAKDLAVREAIVPRLTRVAIDSGMIPAQDSDSMLFR